MESIQVDGDDEGQPLLSTQVVAVKALAVKEKSKQALSGFQAFLQQNGNVVSLAVAFILGASFQSVVTSLVNDILMPPIGLVTGGANFGQLFAVIKHGAQGHNASYATIAQAAADGAVTENYGRFIQTLLNFFIIALLMYAVVSGYAKLQARWSQSDKEDAAAAAAPPARKCDFCCKEIDEAAVRCPFCTSELKERKRDLE